MFSDQERDALAQEILSEELNRKASDNNADSVFHEFLETENGEPVPVYGGTSTEGYGSFRCEYMPLDTVRKIIQECELLFDQVFPQADSMKRKNSIKIMAEVATCMLLLSLQSRLCDVLEENFQDSILIVKVMLGDTGAHLIESAENTTIIADLQPDIDQAAKRVASQKRKMLANLIKGLPHILVERAQGRPRKTLSEKEKERRAFEIDIEREARSLISKGEKPGKTKIARALRCGGVSPRTGNDTALHAFNNKLKRLEIDFNALIERLKLNK